MNIFATKGLTPIERHVSGATTQLLELHLGYLCAENVQDFSQLPV